MTDLPLVCISILNWNGYARTLRCLQSLTALTYPHYFVVIVDNASRDESVAAIRQQFPDVPLLTTAENLGFAGGHAVALDHARTQQADLLWILNNDLVVEADALAELVTAYRQLGNVLLSSTPVRTIHEKTIVAFHPKYLRPVYRQNPWRREIPYTYEDFQQDRQPRQVAALPGSCLLVPLQVIAQHGFIAEEFFLYGEEIDYCLRLKNAGILSYIVPSSRVWHEGGGSQMNKQLKSVIQYYRTRNEIVKAWRHDSKVQAWVITAKKVIKALLALRPGETFSARMILMGIVDAWRGRLGKTFAPEDYTGQTSESL
jgi:GT2 family glycosyltransferase